MVLSPKDPFNWASVFQQRGVRDTLKRTLKGHTEGTIQISACIIFRVVEDIVKGPRSKESKKGAVALTGTLQELHSERVASHAQTKDILKGSPQ